MTALRRCVRRTVNPQKDGEGGGNVPRPAGGREAEKQFPRKMTRSVGSWRLSPTFTAIYKLVSDARPVCRGRNKSQGRRWSREGVTREAGNSKSSYTFLPILPIDRHAPSRRNRPEPVFD